MYFVIILYVRYMALVFVYWLIDVVYLYDIKKAITFVADKRKKV